ELEGLARRGQDNGVVLALDRDDPVAILVEPAGPHGDRTTRRGTGHARQLVQRIDIVARAAATAPTSGTTTATSGTTTATAGATASGTRGAGAGRAGRVLFRIQVDGGARDADTGGPLLRRTGSSPHGGGYSAGSGRRAARGSATGWVSTCGSCRRRCAA